MELKITRIKDGKSLVLQNPSDNLYCSVNLTDITDEFKKKCMQSKVLLGTTLSIANGVMMKIDDADIVLTDTTNKNGEAGKIYNITKIDSLDFVVKTIESVE